MTAASPSRRLVLFALLIPIVSLACVTRQVDVTILDDQDNKIGLRSYARGGRSVDRGYNHPASISAQRIANILSAIEVRVGDRDDHTLYPIVTGSSLQPISKAISTALDQADSSQMVVVKSIRKERRFGVFTHKYFTSFILYVESDYLNVKVSRVNHKLSRDPKAKLPEPRLGEEQMKFRALPGKGMHSSGKQSVAARWRDPAFADATRILDRKDSGARRRQVLLEEPVPASELGRALPESVVDRLSPETLRALADLEEQRRKGTVTEGDYERLRGELLRGER